MKHRIACMLVAFGMVSLCLAQAGTNDAIGLLGYPTGTILTVEGTRIQERVGGWKGPAWQITKINGTKPVNSTAIAVGNIDDYQTISTNTTCCFRGVERVKVVSGENPLRIEQAATPGTNHTFWVIEVVAPKSVKLWSENSKR